tara:strand:+ start:88 stop:462 length:375 start_codon:yes stop_codon:yes gene_type:complete
MSVLTAFTTQLQNLSQNLSEMYPNDPDLQLSKNTVSLMKKTNPRKLQFIFNKYVKQYEPHIMNKNDEFLLKANLLEGVNTGGNTEYAEAIINNLRKYWSVMDDESKENIWKYLKVLMILNNKCA